MGNGDPLQGFGNYAFVLTGLKEAENALNFFRATLPSSSTQVSSAKAWGSQRGKTEPVIGGGHQVSWDPITLTRYINKDQALYNWYKEIIEKGVVDTKQDPTITCLFNDEPVFTWAITGAVITNYSHSDADAQGGDYLTETVTLTYDSAELREGAG